MRRRLPSVALASSPVPKRDDAGVWAMQDQNLDGVIAGLEAAWAFFDGMSQRLVTGNFPATAVRLGPLHPVLTLGFPEYAQHRGFIVGPARTGHRQDKPKVERDVPPRQGAFPQGPDCNGLAHMRDEVPR